jgi:hypothetical protein
MRRKREGMLSFDEEHRVLELETFLVAILREKKAKNIWVFKRFPGSLWK